MTTQLSAEQEQATRLFLEAVNKLRKRRPGGAVSWSTAVKFLQARKFEVSRAITLFEQHEITRLREGLVDLNPGQEPLKSELNTGKFTILPTRDSSGAAIAVFTARIHCPQTTTHQTTLQGLVYQLDIALESVDTQRAGLVFIYDMSDSKYSHFDYDLSQKILTMLKGGYPAKLKKVLIVTAPLWFKAPFKILRLFVREKLRDRVYTVSIPQLSLHIPRECLPLELGGGLQVAHHAWLLHCQKSMANKAVESTVQVPISAQNEVESPAVSEDEEITSPPRESWQQTTESGASPVAPSSASSGFSDDDSLHCENGGGVTLDEFVEKVRSKGRSGLTAEYTEIKARPHDGTFTHARLRGNQAKNRYTDVLCYDHSRVLLSQIDDDPTSDYINANFVDGYKQKNAFISTQGPLPKTCGDFWRMVWEQGTLVVVMTTRVVERGRQKCSEYWPTEEENSVMHGHFTISTVAIETNSDYVVSVLSLTNNKTEESREIHHFQYTSWPDYGVPESAMGMLVFLEKVRSAQSDLLASLGDTWAGHPKGPPIVVHCSAGIGRTGTLCTIDICISRLEETGTVDVRGTVERIRSQRAFSIQMPDQYVFCHIALIEYAISKRMIPTPDLASFHQPNSEDSD